MDVWAGVLPVRLETKTPVADDRLDPSVGVPNYVTNYKRR